MTNREWPRVFIVILHWKNYARTSACLRSLEQVTYPNYEVIVVDNKSCDGSPERLQTEFPKAMFLSNSGNLGFSRGCNPGLREAYERGAAYALLLNNDMEVEPDFLEPAVRAAEKDPTIGLVTGKIMYASRPNEFWQAGGYIHPFLIQGMARGKGKSDSGQYDEICETRWASGAMLLIRRSVLEKVGFLPEEYFFGLEEWDYSTTVKRAGLKILYVPRFKAYHEAGSSYRAGHPVLVVYNGIRNKLIYAQKHMRPVSWHVWRVLFWIYLQVGWPWRAKQGCQSRADYLVRLKAARMAFNDHHGVQRVELVDLELAASRLGPTPTWGSGWYPQEVTKKAPLGHSG
jgi:GT2 family glycosyltransferase